MSKHTFRVIWESLNGERYTSGHVREDRVIPFINERRDGRRSSLEYFPVDIIHDDGCRCGAGRLAA